MWGTRAINDLQRLTVSLRGGFEQQPQCQLFRFTGQLDTYSDKQFVEFMFNLPVSLKIGLGVDLLWLVAESRMMRVKTDLTQTSLLLLNKAKVQIKPGLTWRFNWFVDGDHLWHGLGAHAGYEFIMHHNDELKTSDAGFSSEIIGTTETAESWYANLVSVGLKYDLSDQFAGAPMAPIIKGFMKFPVSGKHLVNASSVGFQMTIHF